LLIGNAQRREKQVGYVINHGIDPNAQAKRCETATACLEVLKTLQAVQEPNIQITDRTGAEITVADLEKLSEKENI
jgi:hypothetical protein